MELVSERLVLRPAGKSDLDFYFEMRNSPEILARADHEPKPRSLVERQLQGWIDRWQEHGFGSWIVFDRQSDQRRGRVELDPMGAGWAGISPSATEVGLIVHPTYWNRGIATEAAGPVAVDCFTRAGLSRLVALTRSDKCRHHLPTTSPHAERTGGSTEAGPPVTTTSVSPSSR